MHGYLHLHSRIMHVVIRAVRRPRRRRRQFVGAAADFC